MNVTLSLTGSAADFVSGMHMVENPGTPDERLFGRFWATRSERRYGRGSRFTLSAPAWVMNWIADGLEVLVGRGTDATAAERKGARDFIADVEAAGIRDTYDGPCRDDLVEAGLMAAEADVTETDEHEGVAVIRHAEAWAKIGAVELEEGEGYHNVTVEVTTVGGVNKLVRIGESEASWLVALVTNALAERPEETRLATFNASIQAKGKPAPIKG